jgi:nitrite reductase/ring-hydroxylating ferredoxin subunit
LKNPIAVAKPSQLEQRKPTLVKVGDVGVVLVRLEDEVCALQGRCPHRGASLACAHVEGRSLICAEHGWDFSIETGVSRYVSGELLTRFRVRVDDHNDVIFIDKAELDDWAMNNSSIFEEEWLLGL